MRIFVAETLSFSHDIRISVCWVVLFDMGIPFRDPRNCPILPVGYGTSVVTEVGLDRWFVVLCSRGKLNGRDLQKGQS